MKLPALVLSPLVLLVTLGAAPALGSATKPIPLPLLSPSTPQGMEGGFWRTDGNFDPILHLRNVLLKQPLDVTPSLIFADGMEYSLPAVHLEPAGVASVDIKIAIQGAPQSMLPHVSQFGMAAISYQWSWSAVIASIQDTDEIASLSNVSSTLATIAVVHHAPEDATQRILRGTWWKPTKGSDYVLQVGNTSLTAKLAQVRVSDHLGNLLTQTSVPLASHRSALLRLSTLLPGQSATENTGDISILYTGPQNGIVASASIEDEAIGYSVTPHIAEQLSNDSDPSQSVTLDAPGIMVGAPDPGMLFPVDTVFTPYSVFHNISTHPLVAQVSFTSDGPNGQPATRALGQFPLAAGQSQMLDLSQYFNAANPLPNGYGHLSVAYQGQYEDLIFDAGSADQSGTYVFQVMPSGEASTTSKIFCYWTIDGDNSSMISVWNYAQTPQDATLTLYYFGGQYRIPIHLDARKSYNLDVMELVKSQVPDADGNLIPSNITSGSATLVGPSGSELERMNVVVSASAYNVRNATCLPICINCGGLTSLAIDPDINFTVINVYVQATGMYTTSYGGPYPVTSGGTWSTGSPSIATVNTSAQVLGLDVGSTSLLVEMNAPLGQYECYNSFSSVCADQLFGDSGTVNVTPALSCTSPVVRGTTTTCTVTGLGGASVSGWQFTDGSGNTVTSSSTSATWSGMIVTGGVVTVNAGGSTLTSPIAVLSRPNFAFTAVSPTSESDPFAGDGCNISVASPPVASGEAVGIYCLQQQFNFYTSTIGDGGPNNGYSYVASISSSNQSGSLTTGYFYIISPDLQNTSSAFYQAQCGNYNAQTNPNGFISGANLLADATRHESGTVQSHYENYVVTQNSSTNNLGAVAEGMTGLENFSALANSVTATLSQNVQTIFSATNVEPCGTPNVAYNASCVLQGYVNFQPYQACN